MVVSFNPAMSTGNTIAFGKSESKGTLPRVSMNSMADTVEIKQAAKESKGFFANTGRYIRRALGASAMVGALVACDPTGIGNEIENPIKSEIATVNDMLKTISLSSTSNIKSGTIGDAEIKALGLDTLYLQGADINGNVRLGDTGLGLAYGGKTPEGKHMWYTTSILSDGKASWYGKMELVSVETAEDGTKNAIIDWFGSLDGKYKGTKFDIEPTRFSFELPKGGQTIFQSIVDGGNSIVKYTSKASKEAYKDIGLNAISVIKRLK